jgi:hypothetical protein
MSFPSRWGPSAMPQVGSQLFLVQRLKKSERLARQNLRIFWCLNQQEHFSGVIILIHLHIASHNQNKILQFWPPIHLHNPPGSFMGMRNKTQPTSQYPSYPIVHTKYAQKMKHHKTVNLYTVKTCENHGFPIVFLLSFCKKTLFNSHPFSAVNGRYRVMRTLARTSVHPSGLVHPNYNWTNPKKFQNYPKLPLVPCTGSMRWMGFWTACFWAPPKWWTKCIQMP